jgi:hypothetical protein
MPGADPSSLILMPPPTTPPSEEIYVSSAAERDAIATLAEKAWPYFENNQVKWRSKPVTQARLALAIEALADHMRAKKSDIATMTGLTAYREEDGIHITIELGTLPLE